MHVGRISKSFTILDAQSVSSITFEANQEIFAKMRNANNTVFVDVVLDRLILVATSIAVD